ncbi:MAG: hypothetical protein K9G67_12585 [Bacteroidales bacterium]|nr:hypothetical protein [Bacteroidales bacterium]MCF8352289.1 hypothetical protein [Bacteroidales bacterium]MCF8377187.1 hypothetical protein [Bacteroidales bacterium]MCF8401058.1 hypothetical protein [Bacteroidales bacterium]
MLNQFSFIRHDLEVVMHHAASFLPGIEKVMAVYFNKQADTIQAIMRENPEKNQEIRLVSLHENRDVINRMRTGRASFNWFSKEDLSFELIPEKNNHKELFSETENLVLMLRFQNPDDKLFDLLFIYFRKNLSSFGLSRSDRPLSTENKNIIATLLHNSFQTQFSISTENRKIYRIINENLKSLVNEAAYLKGKLSNTQTYYGESILNLSKAYLKEKSNETGKNYILEESAEKKLSGFKGNINHLHAIINQSVIYLSNMYPEKEEIVLREWDINLENYQAEEDEEKSRFLSDTRYLKTISLLDRLETAARKLSGEHKRLTGNNVGKTMPNSISAPAISDSLKKHKKKILLLFEKYPDKWELIRERFKPVQNLLTNKDESKKQTA